MEDGIRPSFLPVMRQPAISHSLWSKRSDDRSGSKRPSFICPSLLVCCNLHSFVTVWSAFLVTTPSLPHRLLRFAHGRLCIIEATELSHSWDLDADANDQVLFGWCSNQQLEEDLSLNKDKDVG